MIAIFRSRHERNNNINNNNNDDGDDGGGDDDGCDKYRDNIRMSS